MTPDQELSRLALACGVLPDFVDMAGKTHLAGPDTQRALLRAEGIDVPNAAAVREHLRQKEHDASTAYLASDLVVGADRPIGVDMAGDVDWTLLAETGGAALGQGRANGRLSLPPLPPGIHSLKMTGAYGAQSVRVISAPERAPSVFDVCGRDRGWGIMAAFYGLKSEPRKTLADYGDLAGFCEKLGAAGAGFLGINPVHALGTAATDTTSPYSPTHRGFLATDHIAVDGAETLCPVGDTVDYAAHRQTHRATLEEAYRQYLRAGRAADARDLAAFSGAGGHRLRDFARFEALSSLYGPDSRTWPASAEITSHVSEEVQRFHIWLQWMADRQLSAAQHSAVSSGMGLGLYLDLAVGARLGGAESWGSGAVTAPGVSLGAPPDHLSPAGQNWQLAALSPGRLRSDNYDAFRFILRQNMRHCGVLRIDHALGLSRSFWLPEDGSPGGYIRQPLDALLAIIAIEARRAGTVVVGEDLGLVPQGFREEMASRGLYGYSVLQYEKDAQGQLISPDALRPQSVACFGTHDTPTLEGFWTGRDIAWWERLGWITREEAARAMDRRTGEKRALAGLPAPHPLPRSACTGVRDAVHANLAQSPAALVAVQLDDILCLEEAQNLPGTIDEHPNWRRLYPRTLEQLAEGGDLAKTADILTRAGRGAPLRKDRK